MEVRKSTLKDIDRIQEIYAYAREIMKENNNPLQWKNTDPLLEEIIEDINSGNHYIIEEKGHIYGVFSLIFGKDPTYSYIEGSWLNELEYATIHKLASSGERKGILKVVIDYALTKINNIRIDTHRDNSIMHHLLTKYGFTRCGIIYLANKEERIAYQKYINIWSVKQKCLTHN